MAIRSESRVTIAGTVPEVWAYVCDVGRWQEWAPTVRECWVAEGGPLQPGSRVEQRAKGPFGSTRYRAQDVTVGRGAPPLGVRRTDGHVRGALGNGAPAD